MRPRRNGADDFNLTASPWIGSFDVLPSDTPPELLGRYDMLIFFDREQYEASSRYAQASSILADNDKALTQCIETLRKLLPVKVEGKVGCAHARADGRYLLGVFNNLGITKTDKGETADPAARQRVTIRGNMTELLCIVGSQYITEQNTNTIDLDLPAGEFVLLSIPD